MRGEGREGRDGRGREGQERREKKKGYLPIFLGNLVSSRKKELNEAVRGILT